jgi:ribosome maturation factor RimP
MDTTARVRLVVAPLVAEAGAGLYDLEYAGGVLRVTVEHPDGVDLGLIASLTREISRTLDEVDPIAGQYTLEVSSPGLERPLRRPEHFASAVGSVVSVKARAGVEGDRRIKGVLLAADDATITIAPTTADPGQTRVLALDEVEKARTVFEWGPTPKPGTGSRPGAGSKSKPAQQSAKQKKAAKP